MEHKNIEQCDVIKFCIKLQVNAPGKKLKQDNEDQVLSKSHASR